MSVRRPAFAGQFYPSDLKRLLKDIERFVEPERHKKNAIAIVAPHAGYMYSGKVAGTVYSSAVIPKKVIIIGPKHREYGHNASIVNEGVWQMPMGNVEIEEDLANSILRNSEFLIADDLAHQWEHSLEVQVPFLQYFQPEVKIVPIVLGGHDYLRCESIGKDIASGIKEHDDIVLIVASTDLTHYEPQSIANQQDKKVIKKIEGLDARGVLEMVLHEGISMCGFMPVTTAIIAAKQLGAQKGTLIDYMTSGDVSGDKSHVVGYAGIIIN